MAILSTVVAAIALGGCGGGSSEANASKPLTKKEFLKRANALCDAILEERDAGALKAYAKRKATIERFEKRPSKAALDHIGGEMALENDLPLYRELVHRLGELRPPANDEKTIVRMLSNYETVLDRLFEHPEELHEAEPLAPDKEAAAYGLFTCHL